MCGIVGIFQKNNSVDEKTLLAMNDSIAHRGPDDAGFFIDGNFGMAMRRLSIIDIASGHQPMSNETGDIWIVFNGEIYNFLEIKKELLSKGHKFKTNSDTETIVHAYEEYGQDCLQKFNGMFGFCIYDQKKQNLFIARDRMGEKPLYYSLINGNFYFGSEIKAILANPNFSPELNHSALDQFFSFNYIPAPQSIIQNIKKLPPAHYLTFSLKTGDLHLVEYWQLDKVYTLPLSSEPRQNIEKNILSLLANSVKNRLISEAPLGIFLSGGVDSSAIVALASSLNSTKIKTYSVVSQDKSFDEREYSRKIAKLFNTEHTEIEITSKDALDLIPRMADFMDEPFGDASIIPTFLLCQKARQYITVAMGGDGSDELFAGYPTHTAHRLSHWYLSLPKIIRKKLIEKLFVSYLPTSLNDFSFDFKVKKFLSGVYQEPNTRHFLWQNAVAPDEKKKLYDNLFNEKIEHYNPYDIINERLIKHLDQFRQIEYLDLKFYLPDDILFKVDRASMANSLEVRSPFLDYELVEYAVRLPQNLKIKNLTSKYIFKKSLEKILPRDILYRKKHGFGIPVGKWLKNELHDFMREILSKDEIEKSGLFNFSHIQTLMDEHKTGAKDNRKQLWALIVFHLWQQKWLNKK